MCSEINKYRKISNSLLRQQVVLRQKIDKQTASTDSELMVTSHLQYSTKMQFKIYQVNINTNAIKQIHLVGKRFRLKIHQNTTNSYFFLMSRSLPSEEAGTSSYGSWHDENLNLTCQESGRMHRDSWIVHLPCRCTRPP